MSYKHVAVEHNMDGVVAIHVFFRPTPMEKGFYRHVTALESFNNHQRKKFDPKVYNKKGPPKHWLYIHSPNEFELLETMHKELGYKFHEGAPRYEHPDVYALFEAVGWDHKRKKWLR